MFGLGAVLLWLVGAVVGWVILYLVVKAAVRNGILEADAQRSEHRPRPGMAPDLDLALARSKERFPDEE